MVNNIGAEIRGLITYDGGKRLRKLNPALKTISVKKDTFTRSSAVSQKSGGFLSAINMSDEMRNGLKTISEARKNITYVKPRVTKDNEFPEAAKFNFEQIDFLENNLNEYFRKKLDNLNVPDDVTFEFDYNIDLRETTVTNVSDENYREIITDAMSGIGDTAFLAYASRIMNGHVLSALHPRVANGLMRHFGQDISDLYIDSNGNLGGANKQLEAALKAEKEARKNDRDFDEKSVFGFQSRDVEKVIKRMAAGGDITPNISHMGYDGERFYTNDGEFKFGKECDRDMLREEKYLMRGSVSLYILSDNYYDRWIDNEKLFY